jgi:wobble nucleotide-excising tRNase
LPWQFNLMKDTAKVKGHAHLVRDLKSQAIVNTDSDAYARYMARKRKQKEQNDEIRNVIRDVNELRTEMREIKDLLLGIANGR